MSRTTKISPVSGSPVALCKADSARKGMSFLFPFVCLLVVLTTASCDWQRMRNQASIRPYEQQMPAVVPLAVPTDGGENRYEMAPEGSLENPVPPTPESINRGGRSYTYFCIPCHGSAYNGDGTVGQSFYPLPADLRSPMVQNQSEDSLFRAISYGFGRHPPLANTISVVDRWHLINWIRSLGEKKNRNPVPSGDYSRSAKALP